MPERAVRFGIADSSNRRAASWKCLTYSGTGKKDVYVACRALAGAIKLSLHETGRWHVAFDYAKFPTLFEPSSAPPTRFSGVWERAVPIIEGLTLACRIHTPWYAATIQEQSLEPQVTWIAPAPTDQSVEVAVFLCDQLIDPNAWPGRRSMQTQPVGWFELDGGGCVWVVHRCVPAIEQKLPPVSAPRYFRGQGESDLLEPGARAIAWGAHTDGSIVIQEGPVLVSKNERS
jgi:hypothetical protein